MTVAPGESPARMVLVVTLRWGFLLDTLGFGLLVVERVTNRLRATYFFFLVFGLVVASFLPVKPLP